MNRLILWLANDPEFTSVVINGKQAMKQHKTIREYQVRYLESRDLEATVAGTVTRPPSTEEVYDAIVFYNKFDDLMMQLYSSFGNELRTLMGNDQFQRLKERTPPRPMHDR